MYASGSKAKCVVNDKTPASSSKTSMSPRQLRYPRASASANGSSNATSVPSVTSPPSRSKFTERKSMQMIPLRTRSLRLDTNAQNSPMATNQGRGSTHLTATLSSIRRSATFTTPKIVPQVPPRTRVWSRKQPVKATESVKVIENIEPIVYSHEIGIQTNEPEILNHDLLIGDIKLLMPSRSLIDEIDRLRQETRTKMLLKAQRKFEEHSERQGEHLSDLKEFLEKAVVTKRGRKPKSIPLGVDRKLISSMDVLLNREVPRSESITNIKGRIKKKEQELLNLFNSVENMPDTRAEGL